jgi:hypothetical protein
MNTFKRRIPGKTRTALETERYEQGVRARLPVLTVTGAKRGPLAVIMASQHGRELQDIWGEDIPESAVVYPGQVVGLLKRPDRIIRNA